MQISKQRALSHMRALDAHVLTTKRPYAENAKTKDGFSKIDAAVAEDHIK